MLTGAANWCRVSAIDGKTCGRLHDDTAGFISGYLVCRLLFRLMVIHVLPVLSRDLK